MPIKFDLSKYNNNKIFIETGTFYGGGIRKALKSGFEKIISIELDKKRYEHCKKRFKKNKNVRIINGNSGEVMGIILKQIKEPCTFFLDAHYCGEPIEQGVALADKWCPMNEELDAIENHNIKTHTILIDDMRCIENTHIDKKTNKPVGFPGKENLLKKLKKINKNYKIEYLPGHIPNDVLLAYIN
jgi:hypothetical protein